MIDLVGYNFFGDVNALDPVPTAIEEMNSTRISSGIIDTLNVSEYVDNDSQVEPEKYSVGDIIHAAFNGNLAAGSLEDLAGNITGYKVKRRRIGDFEWVTLFEKQITTMEELSFVMTDNLAKCNVEYEYAFVPLISGQEGRYIIRSVLSKFNGIFFADNDTTFKLDADVSYGATTSNQKVGIYEPFGRKYPVVISNGITSYDSGSVAGTIMPENYDPAKPIDRQAVLAERKLLIDFLNNRRPKILKDWNGAAWIVMITNNPSTEYLFGSGMGLMSVSAGWTQTGDADSKEDLYANGLIATAD